MLLHVSMRILCHKWLCTKFTLQAKDYLKRFVLHCSKLYYLQFLVPNVNCLIHLADDVQFFKCSLNEITAFPFENALGKLKKLVHSGKKPLEQLCRRLSEQYSIDEEKAKLPPVFQILQIKKGSCKKKNTISSCMYNNFTYTTKTPNNCV